MPAIVQTRAIGLSTLWVIVVIGSILSVLIIVLGTILRRTWLWTTAIALISTTLVAAVGAAVLDHLGYGH